jgi:hypothetical protein
MHDGLLPNAGTAGVPPAMSAQREQFDHSNVVVTQPGGRDARGPSVQVPTQ